MTEGLVNEIRSGNPKALARAISIIENETDGFEQLLLATNRGQKSQIIGLTGPPGAGKSTLADSLIGEWLSQQKKIAVLCVDPSSPFNLGSILGDRIRLSQWYTNPNVFIRSLATRGAMGGLNPKIIEITHLLQASNFDRIIIETVGVGQSEIEIAGLADVVVVALVPESGDEVQTMKAGVMEIADVFVVNKADRPNADLFVKNLELMLAPAFRAHENEIPILKTIATSGEGIPEFARTIDKLLNESHSNEKHLWLLTERAFQLIQKKRMQDVDKSDLKKKLEQDYRATDFNLYSFVKKFE